MAKHIDEVCKSCYTKHQLWNSTIYTDLYGKTVIQEESFATIVYNYHNNSSDIFCNKCGYCIGNANCTSNSFWDYVRDVVKNHQCNKS